MEVSVGFGLPAWVKDVENVRIEQPQGGGGEEEEKQSQAIRSFRDYFLKQFHQNGLDLQQRIEQAQESKREGKEHAVRFLLNLDELRVENMELAKQLLNSPLVYLRAAKEALEIVCKEEAGADSTAGLDFFLGVVGSYGSHSLSPRGLRANFLGKLVSIEGIVTKMGTVKPKLVELAQWCRKTDDVTRRSFRDGTSMDGLPTSTVIPTRDEHDNILELEFGESKYRDYQKFTVQEMPERAPLGQLPRSVEVICEDDLVDLIKPGDRVQVNGLYRAIGGRSMTDVNGLFRTALVCNSLVKLGRDVDGVQISDTDAMNIQTVAHSGRAFDLLAQSLAPSIYGHEYLKKAVLLLLLGGVEKVLENGTHLRGDINLLVVGDPSVAKSQMLRFVLGIAPLAISTTGRGSSGVGLTAAVTTDPDTGERRLEAGAMVLADRGVVLIDEFDKMGDGDRVAIHEIMEQQTVTIAKAGIHASLNARCSVLAAANPIYGQYNKDLSPQKNIGLPDSLLSRFDLLFVVLDNSTADNDRAISEHVLRMHRYQEPGREGKPLSLDQTSIFTKSVNGQTGGDDGEEEEEEGSRDGDMYQAFNPVFNPRRVAGQEKLFSTQFIRKYIHYAKQRIRPKLTEESSQLICDEYKELRSEQATKTLPITPRCLETMIRISTAHAKCRFSNYVDAVDCQVAREVLRYALFNDTEMLDERNRGEAAANNNSKRVKVGSGGDEEEEYEDQVLAGKQEGEVQDVMERLEWFQTLVAETFESLGQGGDEEGGGIQIESLLLRANSEGRHQSFTLDEVRGLLAQMQRDNIVFVSEEKVHRV
ncbi:hypothetical protein BASA81_003484 [Batrachochytrium salamandrivorans]|nr:hypothetical protein BASA81_003484 [Batrachochytrium salamandrivorans]